MKKTLCIIHYTFYILLILTINNCSSTTEVSKGDLTGIVNLEGMEDNSGIIVAIYELAELDETIVGINSQYPHIGVIINQHTEFDHRLQEPVKYTETDAEGYFKIKKIPTGTYNIVAIKDSFGFKYIYEINIQDGENELSNSQFLMLNSQLNSKFKIQNSTLVVRSANITLYPETTYTNQVPTTTFLTDHHYIIDDPYGEVVLYNNSLTIQPGAVVRITPNTDFKILGTLTAQGEENNMFWITSNNGVSENLAKNDTLENYNSFELTSYATVSNDLIEWGKWDYGNISFSTAVSNLDINHLICRHSESGLIIDAGSIINTENILAYNCSNSSNAGIVCLNTETINIKKGIYLQNYNGLYVKFCDNSLIKDNYISTNTKGIWSLTVFGNIEHNELVNNSECDIKLAGNTTQGEIDILYNNIRSNNGIWQYEQGSFSSFYTMVINFNNFHCEDLFILYDSSGILNDIDATNNYFDSLNTEDEIRTKIIDTLEEYSIIVLIDNWTQYLIPNAGIQGE
jgi:hypothetical protein